MGEDGRVTERARGVRLKSDVDERKRGDAGSDVDTKAGGGLTNRRAGWER